MDAKKLIEMRKLAEKSVAEMPDGELKLKAFEVILSHLLAPREPTPTQDAPVSPKVSRKKEAEADVDDETAAGRILVLKDEGFFKSPKSSGQIRDELQAHGWHYPATSLSGELISLVQRRKLRRQKDKVGNKKLWVYTNP
ncbi:MAG: hypothetical protein HY298_04580 [Verrucomicrobia bacterium]|nr:hypothetical protein [Verrucomicrobiota bacterium]